MKKLMNLLLTLIAAVFVVTAPAKSYAAEEQGNEELIKEYDQQFDSWVSDGLSLQQIRLNTLYWIHEKHLKGKNTEFKAHMKQREKELQDNK